MATTEGLDLEHNKYVGQASTIVRPITNEDGGLSPCLDEIIENDFDNVSLKPILIKNHRIDANKSKIKDHLPWEAF